MLISIIRTILLYAFVILAVRLMGKRQMSDMQPSELVITMIVSDIASIPMQNTSQPLLSGVIPVAILVALEITASIIMMKWSGFRSLVCGKPVIVIKDGRILQSAMKKLRLTTEDLSVRLRQQGIFSIEDVQYCIVETNGEVSVLEKPEKRKPSLNLCEKEKGYVKNILQKKNIKQSNVFLMTLDALGNYNIIKKE